MLSVTTASARVDHEHVAGHPVVSYKLYWLHQLSNTTNLWYIYVYYKASTKCFGAYGHLQVDELTKTRN